jgi:hypothetical protein
MIAPLFIAFLLVSVAEDEREMTWRQAAMFCGRKLGSQG